MGPNVLWIVLDTARADAFEPYGATAGSSPALADLARAGRAHENVHSTACWTVPAHASMFTGLLPRAAGLSRAPGGVPGGCKPVMESHRDRVLPEVLRRHGYETRAISTNLWVTPRSGFATGFDDFRVVEATRQPDMVGGRVRGRAAWALDALRARSDDGAAEAGRILRGWLSKPSGAPWFCFVNLIEAHSPYLPPKPWNDLGPIVRLRAAEEARRHLTLGEIWRVCVSDATVPPEALERMRHLYARAIRQQDDWLAGVLELVDLAETLVIVCSDHGENLGEGGLIGHAYSLDERLTRVPFVAAGPGAPDSLRSLAELPRLVAAAAGLETHPWIDDLPAAAVAQFDAPALPDDERVAQAAADWGLDDPARERLTTSFEMATDGRVKLVRTGGRLELFDLENDALEQTPSTVTDHELAAALDHPAARAASTPDVEVSQDELERIESQMRTLGYL